MKKISPHLFFALIVAATVSGPSVSIAQAEVSAGVELATDSLPDAPVPQTANAGNDGNSQPGVVIQTPVQKSDSEKADEQIKAQEKQRVLGVIPTFNITYLGDATVSLTAKQKFSLALHSTTDPAAFVIPFFVAGYNEVLDNDSGFPWGIKGYGERAGAAYLDSFDGAMLGNALLPSILHQDPRYFRMGHGSKTRRLFYAASTSFVCKHDKTGKWEPNYSNVAGNIAAGAISNLYYPSNDSGAALTISNGLIVTAEGAFGAIFDEFWPDLSRKFFHKDPTNGLDDKMKADAEARRNGARSAQ